MRREEGLRRPLLQYGRARFNRIETVGSYLVDNDDGFVSNEEGSVVEKEALAMRFNPP